jgi:hypothetical protein
VVDVRKEWLYLFHHAIIAVDDSESAYWIFQGNLLQLSKLSGGFDDRDGFSHILGNLLT